MYPTLPEGIERCLFLLFCFLLWFGLLLKFAIRSFVNSASIAVVAVVHCVSSLFLLRVAVSA